MRQSGRTTKMLTQAIMSDAPVVLIAGPTEPVIFHLRRMMIEMVGKPDKVTDREIVVGSKHYAFFIPLRRAIDKFRGIEYFELFHDHTLFEDMFYSPEKVTSYDNLREYQKMLKRRHDVRVQVSTNSKKTGRTRKR